MLENNEQSSRVAQGAGGILGKRSRLALKVYGLILVPYYLFVVFKAFRHVLPAAFQ